MGKNRLKSLRRECGKCKDELQGELGRFDSSICGFCSTGQELLKLYDKPDVCKDDWEEYKEEDL